MVWPGSMMLITGAMAAFAQGSLLTLSRAGTPSRMTGGVIAPVIQGAGVIGTQGTGVGTPSLAAVAAMKAGLVGQLHMPKVMMFVIGMWSFMFAAGCPPVIMRWIGSTTKLLVAPKGKAKVAPLQTCKGKRPSPLIRGWVEPRRDHGGGLLETYAFRASSQ